MDLPMESGRTTVSGPLAPPAVTRTLPIDAALLSRVLLRLRRDAPGRHVRWTLGSRGTAELDLHFHRVTRSADTDPPTWTTPGRLWGPDGFDLVPVTVEVSAPATDECTVSLERGALERGAAWEDRLADVAQAAVDELAEELLWHATRDDIVPGDK
jgi:hypothetical protein